MARMRSVKPEFWIDRKLARSLNRDQRMLYLALWNQADEWGRLMADPRLIKGQCFPYDDDLSLTVLEGMIRALEDAGVAQLYAVDGDPYVFLPKLAKHQRLEPAKVPSRLPEPPALGSDQHVHAAPEVRANESARDANESAPRANTLSLKQVAGSRLQGAGQPRADESAPSDSSRSRGRRIPDDYKPNDELVEFARQRGLNAAHIRDVTAEFIDYWRGIPGAKGVKLDWDGTWRNWVRRQTKDSPQLSLVPGSVDRLTPSQIENVLGPDGWSLPAPPDGLLDGDPNAYRRWAREETDRHRSERTQAALAKWGRTS